MIRQRFLMAIIEIFTLLRCFVLAAVAYFLKLIRTTRYRILSPGVFGLRPHE